MAVEAIACEGQWSLVMRLPQSRDTAIPAVQPLTSAFGAELRREDFKAWMAAKKASDAHLADLRREGKPLQSRQFRERY